jgi:phage terminase large subunit
MTEVHIDFRLRRHQLAAYHQRSLLGYRFATRVWHRRAGKTFSAVSELLMGAIDAPRPDWRAYYLAPTFAQAKSISWDYLKRFTAPIPGVGQNETELRVDLPNGSRIQLLGAENYHRLRGLYADDVVLDETALIPSEAWTQVLLPALADRQGTALIQGTPLGRMNLFHDLWEESQQFPAEWASSHLTCYETDALLPQEIERLKRRMPEAEFKQEMLCSWDAALKGSFYGDEMARMDADGRVTTVKHEQGLPVVAALDLGWSDLMVSTFWQQAGSEHRCIAAIAFETTTIPDMIDHWKTSLPFRVDHVILPHDGSVTELGSGRTRQESVSILGYATSLAPRQNVHEGIEQCRQLLRHVWLDRTACRTFREALVGYRSEHDPLKGIVRKTPLHSWESHWADSFRTYVTGRPANLIGLGGASESRDALLAARARLVV